MLHIHLIDLVGCDYHGHCLRTKHLLGVVAHDRQQNLNTLGERLDAQRRRLQRLFEFRVTLFTKGLDGIEQEGNGFR